MLLSIVNSVRNFLIDVLISIVRCSVEQSVVMGLLDLLMLIPSLRRLPIIGSLISLRKFRPISLHLMTGVLFLAAL